MKVTTVPCKHERWPSGWCPICQDCLVEVGGEGNLDDYFERLEDYCKRRDAALSRELEDQVHALIQRAIAGDAAAARKCFEIHQALSETA
jgi:hypothetical protein